MKSTTLIIVGAGISVRLGLPTTQRLYEIISILLDIDNEKTPTPIAERLKVVHLKWPDFDAEAQQDIKATLSLLSDGDGARNIKEAYGSKEKAMAEYISEFKKQLPETNEAALKHHLFYLDQKTYDLISLKSIVYSLKRVSSSATAVDIVDILTAIQSSIEDNISIATREIFPEESRETRQIYYCDKKRLVGALNTYKLLVYKIFKHFLRHMKNNEIKKYEAFFHEIAHNHSGLDKLDSKMAATKKESYLSDIGYLTYNWDPVLPFLVMKVHQKLNAELLHASGMGVCKKVYADYGVPFAGVKLSGEHSDSAVYSFSEDAAFLINAFTKDSYSKYEDVKSKILIKIIKLFVPHGLFNVRICPRCQNGFFIFPEDIGNLNFKEIANMFTSDPIPSKYDLQFIGTGKYPLVLSKYKKGLPDEIDCPSCGHPVYFEHAFMEIQSIIKGDKPSAINKIQFDYADFFSRANHIIAIGYSFPKDDIINSVFLKNMKIRKDELGQDCKLTYIGSPGSHYSSKDWYRINELGSDIDDKLKQTLDVTEKIFGQENIRLNFMGFPDVLDTVDISDILSWRI